jgi:hypothetical protein
MDPDLAETGQPYAYAGDNPVNEYDPTGLYNVLRVLASQTGLGIYVAVNQVTTGRGQNVLPEMVRIQFQISARSVETKLETEGITATICNNTRGLQTCATDTASIPLQFTAHPSVLAYEGDYITYRGEFTYSDGFKIGWSGHTTAPAPIVKIRGTGPQAVVEPDLIGPSGSLTPVVLAVSTGAASQCS